GRGGSRRPARRSGRCSGSWWSSVSNGLRRTLGPAGWRNLATALRKPSGAVVRPLVRAGNNPFGGRPDHSARRRAPSRRGRSRSSSQRRHRAGLRPCRAMGANGSGRTQETAGASTAAGAGSRVAWVDAAKGLSIVLVVLHHAVYFLDTSGLAPLPVVAGNEALASLRMPLFFLASGLFVAGPLAAPWRTLLHKRVAFFLWLYLLWTTIRFTFFATLVPEGVDPDDSANPLNVLLALVLPGPSMWFLYALALFSVVGKLLRPVPVAVQLAASGVLSAVAGAGLLEIDSRWVAICRFLFFFLLGWHAKRLVEGVARASNLPLVAAAAA